MRGGRVAAHVVAGQVLQTGAGFGVPVRLGGCGTGDEAAVETVLFELLEAVSDQVERLRNLGYREVEPSPGMAY